MEDLVLRGSQTAKNGFKNEKEVADKFNHWETDEDAKQWLVIMQYDLNEIEYVKAVVLSGYKADINVQVQIKLKSAVDTENIQVKLVSNSKGFNQVDKRWLSHYKELWNIPDNVYEILEYFTGEKLQNYLLSKAQKNPNSYEDQFNYAFELHKNKNYANAIQYYKKAQSINPAKEETYLNLAQIYLEEKKFDY